jgi:adenylyltransferase/sulfurtransferase
MKSSILSSKELRIYKHQIDISSIGLVGQEKIKQARVLIAGAGGMGVSAMQCLAIAGVGSIGICDNCMVEETTLSRQSLYGEKDLGKQKAIISKQKLSEINRNTLIEVYNIYLTENNISAILSKYDIIVDATVSFSTHYIIDEAIKIRSIPCVFGTIDQSAIEVSVFNYKQGPSFRMLYPAEPKSLSHQPGPKLIAGLVLHYGIAGHFMANEALKIILDLPEVLSGKILKFDLTDYQSVIDVFHKQP